MARINNLSNFLTDVATAIREKTGKTDSITPADFDTEIASIEGGGDTPKSNSTVEAYNLGFNSLLENVKDYPKLKNEPVTLYTPNKNFTKYTISRRNAQGYRIIWLPYTLVRDAFGTIAGGLVYGNPNYENGKITIPTEGVLSVRADGYNGYYSNVYPTIEACIEALKSPDTVYTPNNGNFGFVEESPYVIPVSNTAIFAYYTTGSMNRGDLLPSQQISANETILPINE